ncbi:MAG TPA: histidine kinase dimerization/phospho-acceptor domain-containing protein, partial [Candidatus Limnocylindrales bacterium]|nr:histidine kinase dimerization/phospho-acceptor domain-containing protein [Candidatus Limnocylindrales bacterium]
MRDTRSPSGDPGDPVARLRAGLDELRRRLMRLAPRSFQARLTLGFVSVVALTLLLVSAVVVNRLDAYFSEQTAVDLERRAATIRDFVVEAANDASGIQPVVDVRNRLNPAVAARLSDPDNLRFLADRIAQADVRIEVGSVRGFDEATGEPIVETAPNGTFQTTLAAAPARNQTRDPVTITARYLVTRALFPYGLQVTLANPYTFRSASLTATTGLLAVVALTALGLSVVVASLLADRFTTPIRRLTEASRRLAEGDLSSRVAEEHIRTSSTEVAELARQFNSMAARLEESIEIIRRDRDRSRDFLADVSHELRTPIAALRTFVELLQERAGEDPEARAEFLEACAQQLERLDWLAQNLLELSR